MLSRLTNVNYTNICEFVSITSSRFILFPRIVAGQLCSTRDLLKRSIRGDSSLPQTLFLTNTNRSR